MKKIILVFMSFLIINPVFAENDTNITTNINGNQRYVLMTVKCCPNPIMVDSATGRSWIMLVDGGKAAQYEYVEILKTNQSR